MNPLALAGLARLVFAVLEPSLPTPPPTPTPIAEIKQEQSANETPASNTTERPTLAPRESGKSANRQSNNDSDKSATNWSLIFAGVIAVGAAVQIIAVIVQARFTRRGLRLTKQSVDAANASIKQSMEVARLDQRAWVAVTSITSNSPQIGQQFAAKIVVKNTGKTFARHLRVSCFSRLTPKEKTMNFSQIVEQEEALAKNRSVGVLAPDAVYGSGVSGEGTITQESFDRFRAGEILYIFGRVSYEDVFHRPHWTTYCSYITHGEPGSAVFEQYNDIDDDTPS